MSNAVNIQESALNLAAACTHALAAFIELVTVYSESGTDVDESSVLNGIQISLVRDLGQGIMSNIFIPNSSTYIKVGSTAIYMLEFNVHGIT